MTMKCECLRDILFQSAVSPYFSCCASVRNRVWSPQLPSFSWSNCNKSIFFGFSQYLLIKQLVSQKRSRSFFRIRMMECLTRQYPSLEQRGKKSFLFVFSQHLVVKSKKKINFRNAITVIRYVFLFKNEVHTKVQF